MRRAIDLRTALGDRGSSTPVERPDPAAVAWLLEMASDTVDGLVRSEVRDEETARDLVQEIYLNLVRGLSSYDPSRPLEPWLHTVARNRLRDHWRSAVHREQTNADEGEEGREGWLSHRPWEGDSPEDVLVRAEQTQLVRSAVEELPASLRDAVRLRVFEGLSFEEAGQRLGRTAAAVRKRYSRALAALRARLGAFSFDKASWAGVQVSAS